MLKAFEEKIEWGGRTLTIQTGKMARQAAGSATVHYGETVVMASVTAAREPREGLDFFPLTVNYMERNYAAGKIPGGYFKREGRPSEKETLVSRLIDRPIRPLFDKNFQNETQVVATVISHDGENDSDIVALVAVSAALAVSGLPFLGPIGAARVGYKDGKYLLNPTKTDLQNSQLDLVVAGTKQAVLMVESQASELDENTMLDAVMFGHEHFQPIIDVVEKLASQVGTPAWEVPQKDVTSLVDAVTQSFGDGLKQAYGQTEKSARSEQLAALRLAVLEKFASPQEGQEGAVAQDVLGAFKQMEKKLVRSDILDTQKRIDGRGLADVRPITVEAGLLPRPHGSALFTRGETQALAVTTLGAGDDEQFVDAIEGTYKERFMLHYNFPPYSTGEVGRVGFTSRRETGHGKLAWRALHAVLPSKEDCPYTIRIVSEILESNGSSSMATVCGGSLALMDAGVGIKAAVAGIAMGLVKEGDRVAVLSDILGDEDYLGDMDFKVAGTRTGVTALQMDIKITGITKDIMATALNQAREGRLHILDKMDQVLAQPRKEPNRYVPRIEVITIPKDKIREVIGAGGKVVRGITEDTGAKIEIADDGKISVASNDPDAMERAIASIKSITDDPEVGKIYDGTVVKVMDFGAFVNFFGARDGLVHISQLAPHRVETVGDIVKEGDKVKVKLIGMDDRGKIRLSMKMVDQDTGAEIDLPPRPPRPPRD